MALVPVIRLRLLANPHTLRSSHLTKRQINSQSTHNVAHQSYISSDRNTTIIYPSAKVYSCQIHQKKETCVEPRAKKQQFVRKHGTTSNLLNESDRNLDFCFKKIRQYEFENFLCTLLLPEEARRGAIAVRAFNIEIAQVRDSIKDRMIGEMRMQFWRDTVGAMFDPTKTVRGGNPVIAELHQAVVKHDLSKSWLLRVIDSRQNNLAEKPFASLEALENYSESTVSSVNYLLLETVGVRDVRVDHAASHLGKAQGIVTAIRAVPFHAQKRRVLLPLDILIKHGASAEDFVQGKRTEPVREVIFDLASQAHAHLNAARSMVNDVPRHGRQALLTAVGTHDFLRRLRRAHFDAFDSKLQRRNQLLPVRLWWRNFRRSF